MSTTTGTGGPAEDRGERPANHGRGERTPAGDDAGRLDLARKAVAHRLGEDPSKLAEVLRQLPRPGPAAQPRLLRTALAGEALPDTRSGGTKQLPAATTPPAAGSQKHPLREDQSPAGEWPGPQHRQDDAVPSAATGRTGGAVAPEPSRRTGEEAQRASGPETEPLGPPASRSDVIPHGPDEGEGLLPLAELGGDRLAGAPRAGGWDDEQVERVVERVLGDAARRYGIEV